MIRVTCETFEESWVVVVTHIAGLVETPILEHRYHKYGYASSPGAAIRDAVSAAGDFLWDKPETPEHS